MADADLGTNPSGEMSRHSRHGRSLAHAARSPAPPCEIWRTFDYMGCWVPAASRMTWVVKSPIARPLPLALRLIR
jgi:hypothetical protein